MCAPCMGGVGTIIILNPMEEVALKDKQHPSGPVKVRNLTVYVDRDLCIGAATCVAVAPLTFVMDSEAKAIILESIDQDTDDTIIDAARACPVAAIIITDDKGDKVYPQ